MNLLKFELDTLNCAIAASTLTSVCHNAAKSAGWWTDLATGEDLTGPLVKGEPLRKKRNVGELLCLVHSELSEAMEGHRKNLMDDKLPHRSMLEVELADALIRIFDMAGALRLDVAGALAEKLEFNARRPDHKPEARLAADGKTF